MKLLIFFTYMPLVCSELHTFITTYTGINGKTTEDTKEFVAVSSLDGEQIDYYDSNTMEMIPKQDWMKEFASEELWKEDIEIRKQVQQIYKNNIPVLMQRFNQSDGVHRYQRRYGCEWDNATGDSRGFDEYTYDGEDFISLDLKELRYTAHVPQAMLTVQKWNNDTTQLDNLKEYFQVHECVYWLKEFWHFKKAGECKENQYACVVKHQTMTEPIQKNLTKDETGRSRKLKPDPGPDASYYMYLVVFLVIVLVVVLCVLWRHRKKLKACKERTIYYKQAKVAFCKVATQALIPTSSSGFPSPPEARAS